MSDDRRMRAEFCSALPWLVEDMTAQGTLAGLQDAMRAVLAETPVRQAIAGLGIPPHVFEEAGPVRGEEPADMAFGPEARASGEIYRCPDGWCGLSVVRTPGGELPAGGRCWLRDRPLRVVEA